jgi:predicted RNA polymerase sigma factor
VYQLNRAIALAEREGPRAGIAALLDDRVAAALRYNLFYDTTLGELHRRAGDLRRARQHLLLAKTKSAADQEILNRRLAKCGVSDSE